MTSSNPQATPTIELRNVSCRFISPDGRATVALRDFSMAVAKGEFVAVVGPTGCGKSTTLSMITGLLKPTTGEVRVMGQPVDGIDPRIGFVFQADAVFLRSARYSTTSRPARSIADARSPPPTTTPMHGCGVSAWKSSASIIRISCRAA